MINTRIKQLRTQLHISQADLAGRVGVTQAHISKLELGEREPSHEILGLLATALETSVSYLIGETDDPNPAMRFGYTKFGDSQPDIPGLNQPKQEVVSNVAPINMAHMIRIKVLPKDFKVCCGNGIDWGSEAIEFEETLVLPLADLARRYSDGDILAVYAEGDSMEPKVGDGDMVLFVPHEKEVISAGMMMVVSYNGRMIIRGVIENNRKQITLRAMNKEYEDIVVTPDDDFTICGRVVRIFSLREPVPVL